jgi:hypothetical protein
MKRKTVRTVSMKHYSNHPVIISKQVEVGMQF